MLLVHPVLELIKFLPVLIGIFVLGSSGDDKLVAAARRRHPDRARRDALPHHPLPDHPDAGRAPARPDRQEGAHRAARPGPRRRAHLVTDPPRPRAGQGRDRDGQRAPSRTTTSSPSTGCPSRRPARCGPRCCTARTPATPTSAPVGRQLRTTPRQVQPRATTCCCGSTRGWVRYAPLTSSGNVIAAGLLAVLGQFADAGRRPDQPRTRREPGHASRRSPVGAWPSPLVGVPRAGRGVLGARLPRQQLGLHPLPGRPRPLLPRPPRPAHQHGDQPRARAGPRPRGVASRWDSGWPAPAG